MKHRSGNVQDPGHACNGPGPLAGDARGQWLGPVAAAIAGGAIVSLASSQYAELALPGGAVGFVPYRIRRWSRTHWRSGRDTGAER